IEVVRRACAIHLLRVHNLFEHTGAAAAVLDRPRDRREAGVGEFVLPPSQNLDLLHGLDGAVWSGRGARLVVEIGLEPCTQLRAECLHAVIVVASIGSAAVAEEDEPGGALTTAGSEELALS